MKYAQHCDKVKKEMEKSQRTVPYRKVLDMPIEESLTKNKVENPTAAIGKTSKKHLCVKMNIHLEILFGSRITLNMKAIDNGNVPCAIVSTAREIRRLPLKKL